MDETDGPPPEPTFTSVSAVVTAGELGRSWHEGCPVAVGDLRRLELTHWDDTGQAVTGMLVLHRDHVEAVVTVFGALFDAGFPVHSMQPITEFDGDDNLSMAANNTSAFNCRKIDGLPGTWSRHAYGGAIDINPLVNPWVRGARVDPPEGERYVDRTLDIAGLIVAGDVVTTAFAEVGWGWGGDWTSAKDYQHFSATGH